MEKTNFKVEVISFDGKHFKGIVNDEITPGGMKDAGKMIGYIHNQKIFFKKCMPEESLIIDLQGTRRISDKKHRTLYYSGTVAKAKKHASGIWNLNVSSYCYVGSLLFFHNTKGTWCMALQE